MLCTIGSIMMGITIIGLFLAVIFNLFLLGHMAYSVLSEIYNDWRIEKNYEKSRIALVERIKPNNPLWYRGREM